MPDEDERTMRRYRTPRRERLVIPSRREVSVAWAVTGMSQIYGAGRSLLERRCGGLAYSQSAYRAGLARWLAGQGFGVVGSLQASLLYVRVFPGCLIGHNLVSPPHLGGSAGIRCETV